MFSLGFPCVVYILPHSVNNSNPLNVQKIRLYIWRIIV
nr:MAG TPA: hypothetical protein [Caudoviricetes sp.]